MFRDITRYVRNCDSCLRYKALQQKTAGEMHMTETAGPWEMVSVDFMGPFPRSTKGNTIIVIFQDKFTKWVEIIALREATAPALIKVFRKRVYARYGSPQVLISANGRQFTSGQFKRLLDELGIKHRLTPPYTPQANPVERTNRVIKTMIVQYVDKNQKNWDAFLPEFMLAYNTNKSDSTGFTPAYLNFGWEPLPLTSFYRERTRDTQHPYQDPTDKQRTLKEIYDLVKINLGRAFEKQRHHYNLRRRPWCPNIGDKVLLKERNLSSAQKHYTAKLGPKYEGPYTVRKIISPVIVSLENVQGKDRGNAHVKDLKRYPSYLHEIPQVVYKEDASRQSGSLLRTITMERKIILIDATSDPTTRKRGLPRKIPTGKRTVCNRIGTLASRPQIPTASPTNTPKEKPTATTPSRLPKKTPSGIGIEARRASKTANPPATPMTAPLPRSEERQTGNRPSQLPRRAPRQRISEVGICPAPPNTPAIPRPQGTTTKHQPRTAPPDPRAIPVPRREVTAGPGSPPRRFLKDDLERRRPPADPFADPFAEAIRRLRALPNPAATMRIRTTSGPVRARKGPEGTYKLRWGTTTRSISL